MSPQRGTSADYLYADRERAQSKLKLGWCDVRVKPPQIPEAGSGDNFNAPPVSTMQYKKLKLGWCDDFKAPQIPEAGSGDNVNAPPVSTMQYKTGYAGRAVSGVRLCLGDNPAAYPGGECTRPYFLKPVRAVAVSPKLEMFMQHPPKRGAGVNFIRHPGGEPYAIVNHYYYYYYD